TQLAIGTRHIAPDRHRPRDRVPRHRHRRQLIRRRRPIPTIAVKDPLPPPTLALLPYTTLFRSIRAAHPIPGIAHIHVIQRHTRQLRSPADCTPVTRLRRSLAPTTIHVPTNTVVRKRRQRHRRPRRPLRHQRPLHRQTRVVGLRE